MTVLVTMLHDMNNDPAVNISKIASESTPCYIRQVLTLVDTTDRTASTTWTAGASWSPYTMKAYSTIKIYYSYPARNESTSWGGIYFEPQVTFNNGTTWYSLGSRGHDMMSLNAAGNIRYVENYLTIDPGQTADFSFGLRYYFKSFDGTVGLNNGVAHDLNAVSGTGIFHPTIGNNNYQHYVHFIVEEVASLKG